MELQTAIDTRRSIRAYDAEKKVTEEQLHTLIQAAQQAPSWKNAQTGRYDIVCSEEMKEKILQEALPAFNARNVAGASALIVTSYVKDFSGFNIKTGTPENEIGNGWGLYDLGLQCENLLLKAKELGLDTLVMGIRDAEALRELLNIDEKQIIGPVIAVGYAAQEARPITHKDTAEIVRYF